MYNQSVEILIPELFSQAHIKHRRNNPALPPDNRRSMELFARHKDGNEFSVECNLIPFKIDGEILTLCAIGDVSKSKQVEEQTRLLSVAIEQTADCVVITDREGTIQYVNSAFEKESGYSRNEALGKMPRIVKSDMHAPQFYEELWKAILSGKAFSAVFINKKKNGELFYEQKTITPLKDAKGNITHFVSTAKVITEQVLAEQALKQSKERYQDLFENTSDLIQIVTPEGRLLYVNRAWRQALGYEENELKDLSIDNIVCPDDQKRCLTTLNRAIAGEKTDVLETIFVTKDGKSITVEGSVDCRFEAGRATMVVCILRDITERKKTELDLIAAKTRAEQSDKLKNVFISNISHEIRTPLNVILGYTGLIENVFEERIGPEEKGFFKNINSGCKRLIRTVEHILNFSGIQTGTLSLTREKFDIAQQLKDLCIDMQHTATEKNLTLDCVIEYEPAYIYADSYYINQALTNLIDNAIKFTEQGSVFVKLYKENNTVCVVVRDTGIGISEEYILKVFDAFSQEAFGYTRPYEGLGLGLALTKRYIEINNGTIEMKTDKGKGTTFIVRFPAAISEHKGEETVAGESSYTKLKNLRHEGERFNILVVEDDAQSRQYMNAILSKEYDVFIAVSAEEAWTILTNEKIDLILMDLSLRGDVDGIQLTKKIRVEDVFKSIPILAVTAHAFPQDRKNSIIAGCNDYLSKPFRRKQLMELIESYLRTTS